MASRTINLRDMPEELVRRAKAQAALGGTSLKAFVIQALEAAVSIESTPPPAEERIKRKDKDKRDKKDKKDKKEKKKNKNRKEKDR